MVHADFLTSQVTPVICTVFKGMKAIIILLSLCLTGFSEFNSEEDAFLHGQVIHADGSRSSAWVKLPENSRANAVYFRDEKTGESKPVESDAIYSITVVKENTTISFVHSNYIDADGNMSRQSIWMRTVSRGEVTLFQAEEPNGNTLMMLMRADEKMPKVIDDIRFGHEIIHYVSDHKYLVDDIMKGKLGYTQVVDIMNEYNSWKSFE